MDETAPSLPPVPIGADRLVSRRAVLAAAGAAAGGLAVSACSGSRRPPPTTAAGATTSTTTGPATIRIGYVAEVTGPNSFRGEMVTASLDGLQGYLDDKSAGAYRGYKPELIPADAPNGADAPGAYAELIGRHVDAILWCTPFGLPASLPAITSGSVPVISVLGDAYSSAGPASVPLLGPGARGSLLFQTALPDAFVLDVMLAYASEDRGFATAGLLFDKAAYPHVDTLFATAAAKHGIAGQGVSAFDSTAAHVDLGTPIQNLKRAGAHVVVCYALADHASIVATQLDTLDAKYVDTPTTLRSHFKPMLMGPSWGPGDPSFVALAGGAAARGTLSATALANVKTLPTWPMRRWIHDYVPRYNNGSLRGGENGPADAVALLIDAAARIGSTRPADLVRGLESQAVTMLASGVGMSFAPDRHLAVTGDDVALLTVEFPPEPFNLGSEWRDVLASGYQGSTHLVDFTLASNTRAHPLVVADLLARRYGTSATDAYQGGDPEKVARCKALH